MEKPPFNLQRRGCTSRQTMLLDSNVRARNNHNQRKARARKKERVQELERKLREYESEGVKVSKEIQASAKLVAEENDNLRARLQSQGMRSQEIDMATGASGGPSKVEILEAKLYTTRPYNSNMSKTGCSPPQPDTPSQLPLMSSTTPPQYPTTPPVNSAQESRSSSHLEKKFSKPLDSSCDEDIGCKLDKSMMFKIPYQMSSEEKVRSNPDAPTPLIKANSGVS